MKVKILYADLIRRYGNVTVEMSDSLAFSLQKQGKVKILETPQQEEEIISSGNVLIFSGNEKEEVVLNCRIPAENEPLFPQTIIKA